MSLLSKFMSEQLLKDLEESFLSHEKDLQELFVKEVSELTRLVGEWVNDKLNAVANESEK